MATRGLSLRSADVLWQEVQLQHQEEMDTFVQRHKEEMRSQTATFASRLAAHTAKVAFATTSEEQQELLAEQQPRDDDDDAAALLVPATPLQTQTSREPREEEEVLTPEERLEKARDILATLSPEPRGLAETKPQR
jgi:hypothetical protein